MSDRPETTTSGAPSGNAHSARIGSPCCVDGGGGPSMASPAKGSMGTRYTFKVEGLDCAEEVAVLRRAIGPLVGGADNLSFDVLNGRMTVLDGAPAVTTDSIRQAVGRTGMTAVEWRREKKSTHDEGDRHLDERGERQDAVMVEAELVAAVQVPGK